MLHETSSRYQSATCSVKLKVLCLIVSKSAHFLDRAYIQKSQLSTELGNAVFWGFIHSFNEYVGVEHFCDDRVRKAANV